MAHEPQMKATLARVRLIGQLCRSDQSEAAALAAVLADCAPTALCRSAACPICGLAFQATALALAEEFICKPAQVLRNRTTLITIVPASGGVAPDSLTAQDFHRVGDEVLAALAALSLPPTIVNLEADFKEDTTGGFEPYWSVHTHSTQVDWLSRTQERALKALFPRSALVRRPVHCERSVGLGNWWQYSCKFERYLKVTVWEDDHPTRASFRYSKRRSLRPWQAVTMALVDHQVGFSGRLLTHEIDEKLVRGRLQAAGWGRDGP